MALNFRKQLRRLLVDMSWYAHVVPPESIKETASASDSWSRFKIAPDDGSATVTDTYRTVVIAKPHSIPATRLVVKKVKKRKPKP